MTPDLQTTWSPLTFRVHSLCKKYQMSHQKSFSRSPFCAFWFKVFMYLKGLTLEKYASCSPRKEEKLEHTSGFSGLSSKAAFIYDRIFYIMSFCNRHRFIDIIILCSNLYDSQSQHSLSSHENQSWQVSFELLESVF